MQRGERLSQHVLGDFVVIDVELLEDGVIWMNATFKFKFMNMYVRSVQTNTLVVSKLKNTSVDNSLILAELGDKAEIVITQFLEFLYQNQSNEVFVAYCRGFDHKISAVHAHRRVGEDDRICIYEHSVEGLVKKFTDRLVVSRK